MKIIIAMYYCLACYYIKLWMNIRLSPGGDFMKKIKFGMLVLFASLILVSGAMADSGELVHATGHHTASGPSYWAVQVTQPDTIAPVLLEKQSYLGWCIEQGVYLTNPFDKDFNAYSSLYSSSSFPAGSNAQAIGSNWQKINWVLNNDNGGTVACPSYDYRIKQAAIWQLAGQPATYGEISGYDTSCFNAYMASIPATYWVPVTGKFAVILYNDASTQEIIIEEQRDSNTAPEFPTIALPVGMIIGVVGLVYVVKKREN